MNFKINTFLPSFGSIKIASLFVDPFVFGSFVEINAARALERKKMCWCET